MQGYRLVFHFPPYLPLIVTVPLLIAALLFLYIGITLFRYRSSGTTYTYNVIANGIGGYLPGKWDEEKFQQAGYEKTPSFFTYIPPWRTLLYCVFSFSAAIIAVSFLFVELYPL
jgi:hypothetical protein